MCTAHSSGLRAEPLQSSHWIPGSRCARPGMTQNMYEVAPTAQLVLRVLEDDTRKQNVTPGGSALLLMSSRTASSSDVIPDGA